MIAFQRSAEQMRPLLHALFHRLQYVLGRLALYARADDNEDAESQHDARDSVDATTIQLAPELESLVAPKLSSALEEAFESQVANCAANALDVCLADLQVVSSSSAGAAPDVSAIYPLLQPNAAQDPSGDGVRWAPCGWYGADAKVDEIVSRAIGVWRAQFAQAVQRKVHSLFLLTLLDDLPAQLMRCIEGSMAQAPGGGEERVPPYMLDLSQARSDLLRRRERLAGEKVQTQSLLQSFHRIKALYVSGKGLPHIGRPA